jgi:hypothetical protein
MKMKSRMIVIVVVAAVALMRLLPIAGSAWAMDTTPKGQPALDIEVLKASDWWAKVQESIRRQEYHVTWQDHTYLPDVPAAYQAPNRLHNLRAYFTPEGPVVIPRVWPEGTEALPWRWELRLTAWGREEALQPAAIAILAPDANRIGYRRGALTER